MPQLRLIFVSNGKERPFLLRGSRWTIGRDPHSDIVIPDPLVSRRHAVLWYEGHELFIRDAGAKNLVEVNGKAANEALPVPVGARFRLGSTEAVLLGPNEPHARFDATESSKVFDIWALPETEPQPSNEQLKTLALVADALQPVRSIADAAWLVVSMARQLIPHDRIVIGRIGSQDRIDILASEQRALEAKDGKTGETQAHSSLKIPRKLLSELRSKHRAACLCRRPSQGNDTGIERLMAAPWIRGDRVEGFLFVQRRLENSEFNSLEERGETVSSSDSTPFEECRPAPTEDLQLLQLIVRLLDARLETIETIERLENDKLAMRSFTRRLPSLLSVSPETQQLRRDLVRLSGLSDPMLITGEPGSGKLFLAMHLHSGGHETRSGEETVPPFVPVRLTPEGIQRAEDQLFGLEGDHPGNYAIQAAHGGTLCIRNIEHLPESAQLRLTDELLNGRINTALDPTPLRTRLIATSSLNYEELCGTLHPDLIALFPHRALVTVPLRRRLDDIPLLASYFLEEYAARTGAGAARVSPRAMDRLRAYHWPNNIKELEQVLETAAVLARGHVIYPKQLPPQFTQNKPASDAVPTEIPTLKQIESEHIMRVLELVGGNKSLACKALGIAYSTLHEKLKLM
ncbi:MAG: hypothetical protein CSA62_06815 [Planctomycetota bacterium]|nr:MAG: hypothetical protein CSA62_06815 [Planctomycetota bacterium]